MSITRILLLSLALVATPAGAADVYVCKGANGVTAFQKEPCPKAAKNVAHATYTAHLDDEPQQQPTQGTHANTSAPPPSVARIETGSSIAQSSATQQHGGIGSSAYQRGEVHAMQCTA